MNPAPQQTAPQQTTVVVERKRTRSPLSIVLTDMLYGGAGGALVGLGIGLIEQDDYAENVLIGTGVGLLAGGIVGGFHAYSDHTGNEVLSQASHARDGLGTLARDRAHQRPMTRVAGLAWRY